MGIADPVLLCRCCCLQVVVVVPSMRALEPWESLPFTVVPLEQM